MQFFIAGTGKGVGKTLVTQAMIQTFNHAGYQAVGYQPIKFSSEESHSFYYDNITTQNVSLSFLNQLQINPIKCDEKSIFQAECKLIDFDQLSQPLDQLRQHVDVIMIDGVGGWFSPIGPQQNLSDWVIKEKLPVILVVGIQKDCINHAQLTAEIIRYKGLILVGWIVNRINPGLSYYMETITLLNQIIKAPLLGEIPYLGYTGRQDLSRYLNLASLISK